MILVPLHVAFFALFARRPFATGLASCYGPCRITFTLDSSAVSREILGPHSAEKAIRLTCLRNCCRVLALSPLRARRPPRTWVQLRERLAAYSRAGRRGGRDEGHGHSTPTRPCGSAVSWCSPVAPKNSITVRWCSACCCLAVDVSESLSRRMIIRSVVARLRCPGAVAFAPFAPAELEARFCKPFRRHHAGKPGVVIGRALAGWGNGSRVAALSAVAAGSGSSAAPPPPAVICAGFALLASHPNCVVSEERQVVAG